MDVIRGRRNRSRRIALGLAKIASATAVAKANPRSNRSVGTGAENHRESRTNHHVA